MRLDKKVEKTREEMRNRKENCGEIRQINDREKG